MSVVTYHREGICAFLGQSNVSCVYARRRSGKTRALLACMHADLAAMCRDGKRATAVYVCIGPDALEKAKAVWDEGGFEEGKGANVKRVALAAPDGATVVWATSGALRSSLPDMDAGGALFVYCDEGSYYLDDNEARAGLIVRIVDAQGDGDVFKLRIATTFHRHMQSDDRDGPFVKTIKEYGAYIGVISNQ